MKKWLFFAVLGSTLYVAGNGLVVNAAGADKSVANDEATVAALDTEYQAAVERNDAATMDRILADDFMLRTGDGKSHTKQDLLDAARSKKVTFERQDDSERSVRVYGDTAVVTALLVEKGSVQGKAFEYRLWFSDVYVRTATGWRYVFGQASLPLPGAQSGR